MGGGRGCYAGSPLSFQCSVCRRKKIWHIPDDPSNRAGRCDRVKLTGKRRKHTPGYGSLRGRTMGSHALQYKCTDCGHVGWSAHDDLARYGRR